MKHQFEFVTVPKEFEFIVGKKCNGTRHYTMIARSEDQIADVFDQLSAWFAVLICISQSNFYTIGVGSKFVGVSRTAIHKRIKEGRITAFTYTEEDGSGNKKHTTTLIPYSELVCWRMQRLDRCHFSIKKKITSF